MANLRTISLEHFNLTAESAEQNMKNHIENLVQNFSGTKEEKIRFQNEMNGFMKLFKRYMQTKNKVIDWNKIESPGDDLIIPMKNLTPCKNPYELANKLCVLKLNGGLGTTMGCVGPKSAIEVREGSSFLDLNVKQIKVYIV